MDKLDETRILMGATGLAIDLSLEVDATVGAAGLSIDLEDGGALDTEGDDDITVEG